MKLNSFFGHHLIQRPLDLEKNSLHIAIEDFFAEPGSYK